MCSLLAAYLWVSGRFFGCPSAHLTDKVRCLALLGWRPVHMYLHQSTHTTATTSEPLNLAPLHHMPESLGQPSRRCLHDQRGCLHDQSEENMLM